MPKTSLKKTPAQVFLCEFYATFQKTLFTEHLLITAPADYSVPTKVLFIDHTFSLFPSFYPFIIDNCNYWRLLREGIKIFFHF